MITFKYFLNESNIIEDSIYAFADKVRTELNLSKFDLWVSNTSPNVIGLRYLIVDKDKQSNGDGTKAMKMLCKFADDNHLKIVLSPLGKDVRLGTTSRSRLVDFYKRFGFVLNREKHKDFHFMDDMFRNPK